ncbi:X-Pro aminopeptidase [Coraliomargarita sinensis]|uniref:X-Pro aminopeptidase n=1 Tax=Coraliomargarita sinensis TaxID=2174842 RepID=A0A317ZJK0_9BACT|nr:Xaa-Pro peptidase family protein [Coraliomargarita sinensis]PXA04078.1 X-Pro aminopeptidase [Coraliomargarita sinensis]
MDSIQTSVLAGHSSSNATLFHRIRFLAPDASVIIDFSDGNSVYIVRDIEMDRARSTVRTDRVCCAADFAPTDGLSGDRDTALAQATAECLKQAGETVITVDRSLPYLYAHFIGEAGIAIEYSPELGVANRRSKGEEEIEHLRHAQAVTGEAVTFACRTIAHAKPDRNGLLQHEGSLLTSERLRSMITAFLVERNFSNAHDSMVVTIPSVADCHHFGAGPLKADLPVIVDIFPMDNATRYNGDMTRTVVNGTPSDELVQMHATVCEAKVAGCAALKAGTTGEAVHLATTEVIKARGYSMARGETRHDVTVPTMRHGTGHGIGLEVHEPILLDDGAGEILENEIFTVEPGLYSSTLGGVRVEDMVLATENGHKILSLLHEGLNWRD